MSGAPAHAPTPAAAPEPRCRWIEHQGKRILFHDLSGVVRPADLFPVLVQVIALSKAILVAQPPASALTLTNVKDSRFNKSVVDALTDLMKHNKRYVKAGAIVGLGGLQRVIYVTLTQLSGRRLPTFDTMEAAKDWLVTQG